MPFEISTDLPLDLPVDVKERLMREAAEESGERIKTATLERLKTGFFAGLFKMKPRQQLEWFLSKDRTSPHDLPYLLDKDWVKKVQARVYPPPQSMLWAMLLGVPFAADVVRSEFASLYREFVVRPAERGLVE